MAQSNGFGNIETIIMGLLEKGPHRQTPLDLIRAIQKKHPAIRAKSIRSSIQNLVQKGCLTYSHHFSISHLERCFHGPVSITPRISLFPTVDALENKTSSNGIVLPTGASFGAGDHPTTRLALKAVDITLGQHLGNKTLSQSTALDIGTGFGVLALAVAQLGIETVLALDSDLFACREAQRNTILNRLQEKIRIVCGSVDTIGLRRFDLIMANLRPPTLSRIFPKMAEMTIHGGFWVVTGFRSEGLHEFDERIENLFGHIVWRIEESGWLAVVIQRA